MAPDKSAIRDICLGRRASLKSDFRQGASAQIRSFLAALLTARHLVENVEISAYLPIRSEVDLAPLLPDLGKAGALLSLPVVVSRTTIVFRRYASGDPLSCAGFGTIGPEESAAIVEPQVLLMPLAGFDARGGRIGYGAGHYDRALQSLRQKGRNPITIGVGFAVQQVSQVPVEPHDIPLCAIVTEAGVTDAATTDVTGTDLLKAGA
uniref:5-formyltetrahydrofolate cyclo-ligase n=1 Tax=Pararhizobium sp. IMCC3301 TaxID=3067904 RepID=UPI002740702F|nr:5-formyltetrahydrofolate cyclo-ligase [Pararhizobium sp. IMCC3301]